MRIDGARIEHLSGAVDHGDLHAGTEPRVEPESGAVTRGCRQEQILQVLREHRDSVVLGTLTQTDPSVDGGRDHEFGTPCPPHGGGQPGRRGAGPGQVDAETRRDHRLITLVVAPGEVDGEHALLLTAQHGEHPVRRHVLERLREIEVVAEFLSRSAFRDLLRAWGAGARSLSPERLAHLADELCIFTGPLDEDVSGTLERRSGVGHRVGHEFGSGDGGVE